MRGQGGKHKTIQDVNHRTSRDWSFTTCTTDSDTYRHWRVWQMFVTLSTSAWMLAYDSWGTKIGWRQANDSAKNLIFVRNDHVDLPESNLDVCMYGTCTLHLGSTVVTQRQSIFHVCVLYYSIRINFHQGVVNIRLHGRHIHLYVRRWRPWRKRSQYNTMLRWRLCRTRYQYTAVARSTPIYAYTFYKIRWGPWRARYHVQSMPLESATLPQCCHKMIKSAHGKFLPP